MRKLIVLKSDDPDYARRFTAMVNKMGKDECIVCNHDVKIYNIDECSIFTKKEVRQFLTSCGIKLK